MLTISVWPRRLKEFLLTHPLYKSPSFLSYSEKYGGGEGSRTPVRNSISQTSTHVFGH